MEEKLVKVSLRATLSKEIEFELQIKPILLPNGEIDQEATIAKAEKIAEQYGNEHKWDAEQADEYALIDGTHDEEGVYTYYDDNAENRRKIRPSFDKDYALRNSEF